VRAQALLPVLRASSVAHPRLHSLWPTLLALLLPGYALARVRRPVRVTLPYPNAGLCACAGAPPGPHQRALQRVPALPAAARMAGRPASPFAGARGPPLRCQTLPAPARAPAGAARVSAA